MADREVDFNKFCKKCKYETDPETEGHCAEYISNPTNVDSIKPVHFEEK